MAIVPRTRRSDPDTSHMAEAAVRAYGLTELQDRVLTYALARGHSGFTDVELGNHFGTQGSTYRTRRSELQHKGLIEDSGGRRRVGSSSRWHVIWVHVQWSRNPR